MWNRKKKNYKIIINDLNYADFEINDLEWKIRNAMTELKMEGIIECEPRKGNEQADIVSKLNLADVSQQRELLLAFGKSEFNPYYLRISEFEKIVDRFLANNSG
jgi:hypothetical protein